MSYPLEEKLTYPWLALLVQAMFYGIYFAKMLVQHRHGIRSNQIGRRKESSIHTVETLMSVATLGAPAAQIMSIVFGWNHLPANACFTGFCIGMLGDAIFLLSVLCMRDSWRAGIPDKDKTSLVTTGTCRGEAPPSCGRKTVLPLKSPTGAFIAAQTRIYRYSRNPAFLGFDLQYIGVLLMYGNLLTVGFTVFAIVMLHLQILQEEKYLTRTFGTAYTDYCRNVRRYL